VTLLRTPAEMQVVSGDVIKIVTTHNFTTLGTGVDTYSGVRFAADGQMYAFQTEGGTTNIGSWLVSGTNSDFYVVSTIDATGGDGLDTDAGRGPLQLNADRDFYCKDTTTNSSADTATLTFTIEDVATTDFAGPTPLSFSATKTPAG